jgi:ribosome maturation factor RimP
MSGLSPHVRELAERLAAAAGLDILDVRLTGRGRGRVLDVVVDGDGPVPSETTARLAKELSAALDELDPIRGPYTLQVGTPGLDRPLRTPRDFRRQLGHEVRVTLSPAAAAGGDPGRGDQAATTPNTPPASGGRALQGLVRAVDAETLTLEVGGEQVRLAVADIDHGKVVLPW